MANELYCPKCTAEFKGVHEILPKYESAWVDCGRCGHRFCIATKLVHEFYILHDSTVDGLFLVKVVMPGEVVDEAYAGVKADCVREGDAVNFFDRGTAIKNLNGGYSREDAEFVRLRAEHEYLLLYGSAEGHVWSVVPV